MKLPVLRGILFAALFASSITLVIAPHAPVQIVAGILLAYVLPGFVFLAFLGDRGRPGLDDIFLSIIISPIMLILLVLTFHATGSSLKGAVMASSLTLLALLALGLIRETRAGGQGVPVPTRAIVLACVLFSGAVLVAFLANRFLLIRSDAWYHASIVNEIIDRGVPPKEPLLPDVPIRYMWIYHLFIAASRALTGLNIFPALALFNIINALAFPYLVFRLTSFFSRRRRDLIATPFFAIAGLASASWILWPLGLLKALIGEHRGWAEFVRLLREIDVNSMNVIDFLTPFGSMSPVGTHMVSVVDKFITITPFAFSLNIMLLVFIVALSIGFERRFAFKAFAISFFLTLGSLLFHVVGGMALVLSVIGSGLLLVLSRLIRHRRDVPVFHALVLPGAAMLACIAAYPYMASLTAGSDSGNSLGSLVHFGIRNIVTIALPLVILYRPAGKALREIFSCKTEPLAILATWLIALAICNISIDLAVGNESKLVFFLFYILFPPIVWKILDGIEAARRRRRMLLMAWTALLFLVPLVLTFRGAILDEPKNRVEERRYNVTADDRLIYTWIAEHTPRNSVLIESSISNLMPVYAHRRDFYPGLGNIMVFGYNNNKIRQYGSIQDKFLSGIQPALEDIKVLMDLESAVYIMLWREDLDRIPNARSALDERPDWFELVYQNAGGRVYFVRGT
jgi:hypothetical protein